MIKETVQLKDKQFELYLKEDQIVSAISRMAEQIRRDVEGKDPLFVGILNGAYMFVAELMGQLNDYYELTFAAYSSYQGTKSAGIVKELLPIRGNLEKRPVILLEDIIESGLTMYHVMSKLKKANVEDVRLATMLYKPDCLKCDLKPDYIGMEIANDFIVGFGLDYDGLGRSFRNIYKITK